MKQNEQRYIIKIDSKDLKKSNWNWIVDCQYMTITANGTNKVMKLGNNQPTKDWFYLNSGINRIKVNVLDLNGNSAPFQNFKMEYTKFIRKGEIVV